MSFELVLLSLCSQFQPQLDPIATVLRERILRPSRGSVVTTQQENTRNNSHSFLARRDRNKAHGERERKRGTTSVQLHGRALHPIEELLLARYKSHANVPIAAPNEPWQIETINTARNNALFLDQRQKFISTKTVQPKSKQRIVSSRLFFHFSTRITTITLLENVIEYNFIDLVLFFPDIQGGRGEEIKNSSFFYKILKFDWIDFRCCFIFAYICDLKLLKSRNSIISLQL